MSKYFMFTTKPSGFIGIDEAVDAHMVEVHFFAINDTEDSLEISRISKRKYDKMLKELRKHKDHAEYWEPEL